MKTWRQAKTALERSSSTSYCDPMLFKSTMLHRIEAGDVTVAFRNWTRPTVKVGGRLRTQIGELAIDEVEAVAPGDIGEADAKRAGYASLADLRADLMRRGGGTIFRIGFRLAGPDPRLALRDQITLSDTDRRGILAGLDRIDRAVGQEGWSVRVLGLIAEAEGSPAQDLAGRLGMEKLALKSRVRQLKELGLTESLPVGYRLTPRARSYLGMESPSDGS